MTDQVEEHLEITLCFGAYSDHFCPQTAVMAAASTHQRAGGAVTNKKRLSENLGVSQPTHAVTV